MRILLANDDGIDAPGLALLEHAAATLSDDIWIVAPSGKRTAASSSLTIARPLTLERRGDRRFSCSGTPADCVLAAMTWLFKDREKPALVVSGVNDGRNVAEDIAYSGTLGIAREATFWGVPAIGVSRVKQPECGGGDTAFVADMIQRLWLVREEWQADGQWLSVNLPSRLPAPIRQPRIGRDKVGVSCSILKETGDTVEIVVPRGRQDTFTAGDENSLLAAGWATINRWKWDSEAPLPNSFLDTLA